MISLYAALKCAFGAIMFTHESQPLFFFFFFASVADWASFSGTVHGCSTTVEVDCRSPLYSLVKPNYPSRAISVCQWMRAVNFYALFSLDVNCVTLCAFAFRPGASAQCVSVCVFCVSMYVAPIEVYCELRACVRGCFFFPPPSVCTCAHRSLRTPKARLCVCVCQRREARRTRA